MIVIHCSVTGVVHIDQMSWGYVVRYHELSCAVPVGSWTRKVFCMFGIHGAKFSRDMVSLSLVWRAHSCATPV